MQNVSVRDKSLSRSVAHIPIPQIVVNSWSWNINKKKEIFLFHRDILFFYHVFNMVKKSLTNELLIGLYLKMLLRSFRIKFRV